MELISENTNKKTAFLCICSILLIVAGVIYPPVSIIAVLIALLYVISEPDMGSVCVFLMFLYPFSTIFKMSAHSLSFCTIIELVFCLRFFLGHKINKNFVLALLIFVLLLLFDIFNGYANVIKQLLIPLLLYIYLSPEIEIDKSSCYKWYILSVLLSSILGLYKEYIPNMSSYIETIEDVYSAILSVARFGALWEDPNYYNVNLYIAIALLLYLQIQKRISTRTAILGYLAIVFFGIQTGSKSFLLMLPLVIFFAFLVLYRNRRYGLATVLFVGGIVAIMLVIQGRITVFDAIIQRIAAANSASALTTGRIDLWKDYFNYMNEHFHIWIFGRGVNAPFVVNAAHNTYIDFLYFYGIFGTLLLIYLLLIPVRQYYLSRNIVCYLPLIIISVMYFFLSELAYFDFPFHICLCFMLICDEPKFDKKAFGYAIDS